jgi:DNA-binding NarL/FixJ family response regulator
MAEGWSVLIVDDEPDLRALVRLTLQFEDGLEVVGMASDADEAVACVESTSPDLVVLDHLLGGPVTGLQVADLVRSLRPGTRVILFSAADAVIDLRDGRVDAVVSKMDLVTLPEVARRVLAAPSPAAD